MKNQVLQALSLSIHGSLIIFSSLVNEEMRIKGKQLGADAQLTKPEIGNLVEAIDNLIDKSID